MKEFLVKVDEEYELKLLDVCEHPDAVEVPDGATKYIQGVKYKNRFGFLKNGDFWLSGSWVKHVDKQHEYTILWQRTPNQITIDAMNSDESDGFNVLSFGAVDDKKQKHEHYKRDVSHLKSIDPYRIADLYDLHPCAEHIMKKSLCAGNRGHKDLMRDIQDIIDTAERWKEMLEEDER